MAHDERENGVEERPSEKRSREKKERMPKSTHHRDGTPRTVRLDPITGEPSVVKHRRRKVEKKEPEKKELGSQASIAAEIVPEISKTLAGATSRSSLPYPSFSKAHSKEAVSSSQKLNNYTPDPTDLTNGVKKAQSVDSLDSLKSCPKKPASPPPKGAPPSPPATEVRASSNASRATRTQAEASSRTTSGTTEPSTSDEDDSPRSASKSKASTAFEPTKSKSTRASSLEDDDPFTTKRTRSPTWKNDPVIRTAKLAAYKAKVLSERFGPKSSVDSNATSVAPSKAKSRKSAPSSIRTGDDGSSSADDSSPMTPIHSSASHKSGKSSLDTTVETALPPPPPPPPSVPLQIPRIDYLMQNGGLSTSIRKNLFNLETPVSEIFEPASKFLGHVHQVLDQHGSLAVATGYRSVARKLLDRLEVVFGRELPPQRCGCILCTEWPSKEEIIGWGFVLECVSGRIDLPVWPPFDWSSVGGKGLSSMGAGKAQYGPPRPGETVKIDPDITEEFREHYLAQTEIRKKKIDNWLSSCPNYPGAPPAKEVDDETLLFTIYTHLVDSDIPYLKAIMSGSSQLLKSRTPTPTQKPRSDFIRRAGQAIQRLYHLAEPPRDPETGYYLLLNPNHHDLLMTVMDINNSEWDLLTSGRFSGFVWSGAESEFPSMNNSPNISRNPTPANNASPTKPSMSSRITSPFSPGLNENPLYQRGLRSQSSTPFGQTHQRRAVSNDEEMEMAVNAEMERNIYQDMEVLEDLFEALHRKAEATRQRLRDRNAALMYSQSQRRAQAQPRIVPGTPGFGAGFGPGYERSRSDCEGESSDGDWYDGQQSEIMPNDSASQVGSNRYKRPHRRNERRTPAMVEEEDEN